MKKGKAESQVNKNHIPVFLLGGILLICATLIIFYYMALNYAPTNIILYEGYGIEAEKLTKNLKSENFEKVEQSITLLKVEDQETIYKKSKNYFVNGDEQRKIDLTYPIYVNEKSAILNLSENTKIVTKNYGKVEGYANFMLSERTLYNAHDLSKADNNEYILLETADGTYITMAPIKIQTQMKEYTIPINSIMYFTEEYITYYQIENDKLTYNNILEIADNSIISIEAIEQITYREFLKQLEIIEEKTIIEKNEQEKEEEENGLEEKPEKIPEENKTNTEEENKPQEEPERKYIKPSMEAKKFEVGVYTAQTQIQINDPQGRITQAIFIIKRGSKTYQRRQIASSGTIELTGLTPETEFVIEGKYTYYNEEQKPKEETFYKETIKTKTVQDLGSIILEHEPGEIYSNKVEIKDLYIKNEITEEVIKGISKIEIEIDGIQYKLSNNQVSMLKNKEKITYQTSTSVKTNKNITYTIHIYDNKGNELKVENEKGTTKTAKAVPRIQLQIKKQEVNITEMEIKLINNDNVKLENYYYVILNNNKEVIKEKLNQTDKKIERTDLDPNGYYTICFYADYDIEDGKGIIKNEKICETTFTTMPLASLGILYWNTNITELEANRAVISIQINEIKTDKRLIQMIDNSELIVTDDENNIILKQKLNKESIKAEEIILTEIKGLQSNKKYNYEINTRNKTRNNRRKSRERTNQQ